LEVNTRYEERRAGSVFADEVKARWNIPEKIKKPPF
jgi:hypothetical protein